MKKFISTIIATTFVLNGFAQSALIQYRKVLDNGENLSVKTVPAAIKERGQEEINVSLMYETAMKENPSIGGYSLFITFNSYRDDWVLPLAGKLLIRTTSGKVISLSQSVENGISLYNPETGYDNVIYHRSDYAGYNEYSRKNYYRKFGKYPIDENDLRDIVNEGVIKIRLETTGSSIECEYPAEEEIRVNKKKESYNVVSFVLLPYYNALIENINPYTTF